MTHNEIINFLKKIKFKWTTKTGEKILLSEMNSNHVWNAYKRALNKGNEFNKLILKLELDKRGTAVINPPEAEKLLELILKSSEDLQKIYEKYEIESYLDDVDMLHVITDDKYR